jgi:cytochrome c oxidase subunit 3
VNDRSHIAPIQAGDQVAVRGDALDVASLPSYAFSHRSLTWWGTAGLIAIESTVFALTVITYFYLRGHATQWPPGSPPPSLLWGSLNTLVLLVSIAPNFLAKRAAMRGDLRTLRFALATSLLMSFVFLGIRAAEFDALNVSWDTDAYGSVVWLLLGLHTVHLVTDTYDSAVLLTLFFTGPLEGKRLVDASENADYWYFVVISWIPIYLVIYWAPRLH